MHPVVAERLEAIRGLSERYGVRRLWLFGSSATDEFDPSRSDVDFLVEFAPMTPIAKANSYFALHAALESALGRKVDLVSADAKQNPIFAESVRQTRVPLYAAA